MLVRTGVRTLRCVRYTHTASGGDAAALVGIPHGKVRVRTSLRISPFTVAAVSNVRSCVCTAYSPHVLFAFLFARRMLWVVFARPPAYVLVCASVADRRADLAHAAAQDSVEYGHIGNIAALRCFEISTRNMLQRHPNFIRSKPKGSLHWAQTIEIVAHRENTGALDQLQLVRTASAVKSNKFAFILIISLCFSFHSLSPCLPALPFAIFTSSSSLFRKFYWFGIQSAVW